MIKTPDMAEVIRRYRNKDSLFAFSVKIGGVTPEAVRLWEDGGQISDKTILGWWADPRPWVRDMARDVLAAKFAGIREAFLAEAAGNGRGEQAAQK